MNFETLTVANSRQSGPCWIRPRLRTIISSGRGGGVGRERGAASESQRTLAPTKTNNAAQHSWFLHFFFFLYSYYSRKSGLGLEHVAVTSSQLMYPSSTTTSPLLTAVLLTPHDYDCHLLRCPDLEITLRATFDCEHCQHATALCLD